MSQAGRFILAASAAVVLHLAALLAPLPFRAKIIPPLPVAEVRLASRQSAAQPATINAQVSPPAKAPVPDKPPATRQAPNPVPVTAAPVDRREKPEAPVSAGGTVSNLPTVQSQSTAPSAVIAAPVQQAGRSNVSRAPICQREPKPQMPVLSRNLGEVGMVQLRFAVDEAGKLRSVQLIKGSGFSRLDNAAQIAARQWHCQPALKNGEPIAAELDDAVVFELD